MDHSDLNSIQVNVDLDKMRPLETKKLVAFVNCFLTTTTKMLNSFAFKMERKISEMENRMNRAETELKILEIKLDSIPGLQEAIISMNIVQNDAPEVNVYSAADEKKTLADSLEQLPHQSSSSAASIKKVDSPATSNVVEVEVQPCELKSTGTDQSLKMRDDPRYMKYFKMLKMGVVEASVRLKMTCEGIDPHILDTPDAPSDYKPEMEKNIGRDDQSEDDSLSDNHDSEF